MKKDLETVRGVTEGQLQELQVLQQRLEGALRNLAACQSRLQTDTSRLAHAHLRINELEAQVCRPKGLCICCTCQTCGLYEFDR